MRFKRDETVGIIIAGLIAASLAAEPLDEAKKQLLEGKRVEAIGLLRDQAAQKGQGISWLATAETYAQLFIKEGAQRYFELGVAQPNKEVAEKIAFLEKSLEIEPNNVRTLNALSGFHILGQDCKLAYQYAKRALAVFAESKSTQVFRWQALDCLGRAEQVFSEIELEADPSPAKARNPYISIFIARKMIHLGRVAEGQELLEKVSKENQDFPEVWFWLWKLKPEDGGLQNGYARKYRSLCQNLSPRLNQALRRSGAVCWHLSETKLPEDGA